MKPQISNKEFLERVKQSAKKEIDRVDNLSKTELIIDIIHYKYYAGGKISKAPPPIGESSRYDNKRLLDIKNEKELLYKQPIGEVRKTHSALYKEYIKTFSVEEQRKNKLAEDRMPWNAYNSTANYQFWAKMDLWTIHEGITLLLEKEPKVVSNKSITVDYYGLKKKSHFQIEYEGILTIAKTSINTLKLKLNNTPDSFIQWAYSKNILVPEIMRDSVKEITNAPNYENLYHETKKQLDDSDTIPTTNIETDIQSQRENVLSGWLTGKNITIGSTIKVKKSDVWGELSKANKKLFAPSSDHLIKKFFSKQNLCKFQTGRPARSP